jgi:hypothetical protein
LAGGYFAKLNGDQVRLKTSNLKMSVTVTTAISEGESDQGHGKQKKKFLVAGREKIRNNFRVKQAQFFTCS